MEQDLVAHGTVRRGWLGLGIQVLLPELADAFGAKGEKGILVNRVVPGSPAERGGVRMGDILVAFGKSRVSGVKEFQGLVAGTAPGSPVTLEVLREGKRVAATVTVEEAEKQAEGGARLPGSRWTLSGWPCGPYQSICCGRWSFAEASK